MNRRMSETYNCMNPVGLQGYPSQASQGELQMYPFHSSQAEEQLYPPQGGKGAGQIVYPLQGGTGAGNIVYQNNNVYEEAKSPASPVSPSGSSSNGRKLEPWPSQKIIMTGINKKTKCCIATPTCLVLLTWLLVGGVAALTVITYLDLRLVTARLDNVEMVPNGLATKLEVAVLRQELETLKDQLKTMCNRSNLLEPNATCQLVSVGTLQTLTGALADDVTERVWAELNTTQDALRSQLSNVTMATNMVTNKLNDVQSSLVELTNRLNSSVRLYDGCIQDTTQCNISTNGTMSSYHETCATPPLPTTTSGFHTTDMRCEYEATTDYTETTVLRRHDNNTSCECDVVRVNSTEHSTLDNDLSGRCVLVVTRCPILITLP